MLGRYTTPPRSISTIAYLQGGVKSLSSNNSHSLHQPTRLTAATKIRNALIHADEQNRRAGERQFKVACVRSRTTIAPPWGKIRTARIVVPTPRRSKT